MTKFKTGKTNAYVIKNRTLQTASTEDYATKMVIFANNPIVDYDITVLTHGFNNGCIMYGDFKKNVIMQYTNLPKRLSKYFPSMRKINLICCYNAYMKNCKIDNISVCIPGKAKSKSKIYFYGIEIDIIGSINILLDF